MKTFRKQFVAFIITGLMLLVCLPATPAFAEDTTNVDTTNTSEQNAGTAPAKNTSNGEQPNPPSETPVEPIPEPQPVVSDPVPETPVEETNQPPVEASQTDNISTTTEEEPTTPPSDEPDGVSTTTVNNQLDSNAQSGDANVNHNNIGGNATTGDADVIATLLNIIQSVTGWDSGQLNTFIQNIDGDVLGDILIDPRAMSNASVPVNRPVDSLAGELNSESRINNDINLSATSGNAGVTHNGQAGDATSGDANVLLNLINIINSWAVSSQSFIGMINIYGNLNGDILLPPGMIDELLANNGGSVAAGNTSVDSHISQGIANNINMNAQTGNANVSHNDQAGDANTGNALNKLTVLNLTNRQVIGSNAILVFVNVLGNWVGMIVDAPSGATAAALGGGIGSNYGLNDSNDVDLTINSQAQITNNINLNARSGDATVGYNGQAGDATTGDATTSLNLINIINSQLSFSDWFGVLFINVFGSWNGSFGINTDAGNTPVVETPTPPQIFNFVPAPTETVAPSPVLSSFNFQSSEDNDNQNHAVLSVQIDNGKSSGGLNFADVSNLPVLLALGGLGCFFLLGAAEKKRKKHYVLDNQIVWPSI